MKIKKALGLLILLILEYLLTRYIMAKNKFLRIFSNSALLMVFSYGLLTNFNLEKNYKVGQYVKSEDAYFVEKIEDQIGLIKAQKFVAPNDNKYNTQKTRSLGPSLIGNIETVWDSYTGEGTTIAIIDDGFDYNHPEYLRSDGTSAILSTSRYYYASGNLALYKEYSSEPTSIGQDWEYTGSGYEWSTHGTATSTTAAAPMNNGGGVGVAPEADILALKTDFTFVSIKAAIEYAINQQVDVINMSLGAYGENFVDGFGDSQTGSSSVATYFESVCQQAYNAGIIVVAAAGNEATYRKSYPASNYKVIGVGAIGDYYSKGNVSALAEFTNYVSTSQTGEKNVDILAMGYVYTAHQAGTESNPTHTYSDTQGTSFSSPIIAGAAALWKEKYPNGTPSDFLTQLQTSADGIGYYSDKMIPVSGWDPNRSDVGPSNITNGRVNVANLLDINNPHVTTVQSNINISVGEKRQITLGSYNGTISYTSTNTSIATVTSTGQVEGIGAGNANITVTASKNGKTASTTISVSVSGVIATTSMSFTPNSITLNVGDTYDAEETLVVTPSDASRIFLFESSDESIVTINEDTGLITAVGVGSTTINAISVYGDGFATLNIEVINAISHSGSVSFGNTSGKINVSSTNVSGTDNLSNPWTVTTTGSSPYFGAAADHSQIGSSKNPASTIQFTMTLSNSANFTSVSASFGGFSGTSAVVTIKVGSTTIGTGSVQTTDTTTANTSTASGTTLSITLSSISKGIKAYSISYTYTGGGGPSTPPTLTSVNVNNNKTYRPGETIVKSDIGVVLNYSDGTSTRTTDFSFPSDGYRFTYEDTNSGGTSKAKSFSISYSGESYPFIVNVNRTAYTVPGGPTTTLASSQFNASNLPKNSGTPSNSAVTIGGVNFTVTTNAYVYAISSVYHLSFGKNAGSIQNTNMLSDDLASISVTQAIGARQDGVLTISKDASTWVTYSLNEIAKGGYRYFKYAYLTTSSTSGAAGYSNIQSISYTLSGQDNALNVSNYIMYEDSNNQCLTKLDIAVSKLNTMSMSEKNIFLTSEDYVIATARERLEAWARHEGQVLTLSGEMFQRIAVNQGLSQPRNLPNNQTIMTLTFILLTGLITTLAYFTLKKKNQY